MCRGRERWTIGGARADIDLFLKVSEQKLLSSEIHFGAEMLCLIQFSNILRLDYAEGDFA